ncbi:Thionin-like protein 2 [Cardamine amara subsp. amara]|uniref:Thionin-like protein 2 n=1 Tax=Cardamine amara subsp. amara TaxID=228776 RepID=A0ABD1BIK9_CARAN
MESKRVAMLVTMMIVMVIGNLLVETEAQKIPFIECFPACVIMCKAESKFPKYLMCPFKCTKTCLQQPSLPSFSSNEIDDSDDFCKLGCATHHCVSLSSLQNPNVEQVSACVDACSNKCSKKN